MASLRRANFTVELSALPNGRYRVEVRTPIGGASADVDNPFSESEIDELLAILSRRRRVSASVEAQTAAQFGGRMFDMLFRSSDQIYAAYFNTLANIGEAGLRIRLSVERAGALANLPWELIRDPQRDHLALSRMTPVVRTVKQLNIRPTVSLDPPLRVLVVIAAPEQIDGTKLGKLDVEGEWARLEEATAALRRAGQLEIVRLERATQRSLQQRLRTETFHIFHYIGHSDFDDLAQQGVLIFESETDSARGVKVSASALGLELGEESTIRLVVLNSCHSGRLVERDALASIAGNLVTRGIGAVVAMQFAITDGSAKVFSEEFYTAASEFFPIDAAVSEARRAIFSRRNNAEWATPVLYMRPDDEGVLFLPKNAPMPAIPLMDTPIKRRRYLRERLTPVMLGIGALVIAAAALLIGLVIMPALTPKPAPSATPAPTLSPTPDLALLPDLQVRVSRITPSRPTPGLTFFVNIVITNAGGSDSGAFNWAWDASLRPPLSLNTQDGAVENIPPGGSRTISVPYVYGWWGTYSAQIRVDVDSQVQESDERNNILPLEIVMSNNPFDIDFTLLPENRIVQTPLSPADDAFVPWGIDLGVDARTAPQCADVPLRIVDLENGFVAVEIAAEDRPTCALLPISIVVTRRVVANALVEVGTVDSGVVSMRLFEDSQGQRQIGEAFTAQTLPGESALLGVDDGSVRGVRRIDVAADGAPIRLSRLILFQPP
jgi:hypothetical protein